MQIFCSLFSYHTCSLPIFEPEGNRGKQYPSTSGLRPNRCGRLDEHPGSEEFKTTKSFCKTDFDMGEIKKEEAAYVPLPKFYTFESREERERILYKNYVNVGMEVKEMIFHFTKPVKQSESS